MPIRTIPESCTPIISNILRSYHFITSYDDSNGLDEMRLFEPERKGPLWQSAKVFKGCLGVNKAPNP